ncbi:hypothetical protein [Rhodovulum adriaticum]|uniref:TspO/MBR related protein n=1 Tax=Rhodovulum adriaticum TaxID=35804 RepID=A0A4R2NUC5_RHOAD|nr:hypothetical protein [Rhodovulum adriaticum]MBK1636202.1 hypothetical protein [Rhodovulum adriaticum]TCP25522.1 hypothetical protein EV656_103275 [Rhodovulum adriaticum]
MDPIKAVFTFVATLFFVLSPLLSGGFGGFEPAQFPVPQDNPPVQPAGYAFAIWGLIYGWLLVSAGFGLVKRAQDTGWERTRLPLILSLAPGAAWIGVALNTALWASILLWWMLAMALWALFAAPRRDRWLAQAPIAIYAGWLTAAGWVSVGLLGAGYGIGPGETVWALIALAGALATGALVQTRLGRAPEYGATLVWALVGVLIANATTNPLVAFAAIAGIVLIGTLTLKAAR